MEDSKKSYDFNMLGFAGRLTRDPEPLAYTTDGKAYTRVSIANNQGDLTNFIQVSFWNEAAKVVAKYMTKGRYVIIEGKLFSTKNDKLVEGKSLTLLTVGNARIYFVPDGRGNSNNDNGTTFENQNVDVQFEQPTQNQQSSNDFNFGSSSGDIFDLPSDF